MSVALFFSPAAEAKKAPKPVQAAMVIDADTGEILHARNADVTTYPASLTKIMTLYLLFDQIDAGKATTRQRLAVSARAAAQSPSKLGLARGATISVEEAIRALVTKSANDVAVVVAEAIGGTEEGFARMMTQRARQLGMANTVFRNASGLPHKEQVTTARDMATLGRAVLRQHARHYHYFSTSAFDWQGQTFTSHNRLIQRYDGADGIKTGYIHASGFNLISSAKRGNRRLVGVVLGGQSATTRDNRMADLLDDAFSGRSEAIQSASVPAPKPSLQTAMRQAAQDAENAERVVGTGDAEEANWGIQIGAFKLKVSAENAIQATARRFAQILGDGRPAVTSFRQGRNTVYRARILGITEDQARAACNRMAGNKSCMVIQPSA